MSRRRRLLIWTGAAALAFAVLAQDTALGRQIERWRELWAHHRLVAVMEGREPAPFTTDGCSGGMSALWSDLARRQPGLFPPGQSRPPWEDCCTVHDRAYHDAAGARDAATSFESRLSADRSLRTCVIASAPAGRDRNVLAEAMFAAVRLGGGPCSGLPWRWGYGFPDCVPFFSGLTAARAPDAERTAP